MDLIASSIVLATSAETQTWMTAAAVELVLLGDGM
jgi:hypothetical protein